MSTYVVGDIQGCYDELQRLLEKIRFDPAADRLLCPGDLVNRGGKSLKTLRLLHSLEDSFLATLGNHDTWQMVEPLEAMGLTVLANESTRIRRRGGSLTVTGVDDLVVDGSISGACDTGECDRRDREKDDSQRLLLISRHPNYSVFWKGSTAGTLHVPSNASGLGQYSRMIM